MTYIDPANAGTPAPGKPVSSQWGQDVQGDAEYFNTQLVNRAGITTDADASTVTFDMSVSPVHLLTLSGNRTLAVTNDNIEPRFTIILNTGAGSFAPTWWSGIRWVGGTAPTVTTTASKYDVFTFLRVQSGVYLGFIVGQAL